MQKLLEKNYKDKIIESIKPVLTINEIEKFYLQNNCKTQKFGLEYERISLNKNTLYAAKYEQLEKVIRHFSRLTKWALVYDNSKEETLLGAKSNDGSSISLEPGCQIELSLAPEENILDIDTKGTKLINLLDKIAAIYDVIFVPYGINPKQTPDEITILNKERYKIMNNYLPYCSKGELCTKMMRKTAGIQVNIDYKNKKDAYLKLKFFNLIMPFISGLYSNSPIENDILTSHKSNRSYIWLYTGQDRCNMFYKNIFKHYFKKYENVYKNYIQEIIDVPMIYIERNGTNVEINGKITFKQFLKHGYQGYRATMEDYILHQSLCFPDIRLKNYIEIRNHDSNDFKMALALCAFYKGLCIEGAENLLKKFSYLKLKEVEKYAKLAAEEGLDFKINMFRFKKNAWDIVTSLFNISKNNLNSTERAYLKPVLDLIKQRSTPSDLITDYNIKNTAELIDYLYS